jgi:hypothetical protein
MDQLVRDFFLRYERANGSLDVSGIGGLYADTFMFGGPKGVQTVKKEDFLRVVPKMKSHYSSLGLSETRLHSVDASALDSKFMLAKVGWRMTLQQTSGSRDLDTFATYVLERGNGDALSIVFQIDHQDLASVINEMQNTQVGRQGLGD